MAGKGQAFFIFSLVMLLSLLSLRLIADPWQAQQLLQAMEQSFRSEHLSCPKQEALRSVELGIGSKDLEGVEGFLKYLNRHEKLRMVWLFSNSSKVQANQQAGLSVRLLNLMEAPMQNINLSFEGQTHSQALLEHGQQLGAEFSFSTTSDASYELSLEYELRGVVIERALKIKIKVGMVNYASLLEFKYENGMSVVSAETRYYYEG